MESTDNIATKWAQGMTTALHVASSSGRAHFVDVLIHAGADVNAMDEVSICNKSIF